MRKRRSEASPAGRAPSLAVIGGGAIRGCSAGWSELARAGAWLPAGNGGIPLPLDEIACIAAADAEEAPRISLTGPDGSTRWVLRLERGSWGADEVVFATLAEEGADAEAPAEGGNAILLAERMRALGQMVAGVAHDLSNLLFGLRMHAEALRKGSGDIDLLERAIADAAERTARLREFARQPGKPTPSTARLTAALEQAIAVARGEFAAEARAGGPEVRFRCAGVHDLPPVRGSEAELQHVFLNLFLNARDAMPLGGEIEIRATKSEAEIRLTVADRGTGIASDHLPRLFAPYFTTKGGIGLGLPMVQEVLQSFGGSIAADNRPGGGAVFTLVLPRA